jgi:hypothetical protein
MERGRASTVKRPWSCQEDAPSNIATDLCPERLHLLAGMHCVHVGGCKRVNDVWFSFELPSAPGREW